MPLTPALGEAEALFTAKQRKSGTEANGVGYFPVSFLQRACSVPTLKPTLSTDLLTRISGIEFVVSHRKTTLLEVFGPGWVT